MPKHDWSEASIYKVAESDEDRRDYALYAANAQFNFYQHEVSVNCIWHRVLTIVTLAGSALTPVIALFLANKAWIALPSAIAGLAAAANSTFHFEEEWAQSYFTLSALDVEIDKFRGRAGPDYSPETPPSKATDLFQRKVGEIVMSEVKLWRQAKVDDAHHRKTDHSTRP